MEHENNRQNRTSASTKSADSQPASTQDARKKNRFSRAIQLRVTAGAAVLLLVTILVLQFIGKNDSANADPTSTSLPSYQTALPNGKSIETLGGWTRISPADKDPVFAYADKIGDVNISVSQQPLPGSFVGNAETSLADLAKKFSATTKLSTSEGSLFLGTSAKGPQSALTIKDNTLILIKSQNKIDNQAWVAYVDSLGLTY